MKIPFKIIKAKEYNKLLSDISQLKQKVLYAENKLGHNIDNYEVFCWINDNFNLTLAKQLDEDILTLLK